VDVPPLAVMRFTTITTFAVTGRLVALAIAKPIPNAGDLKEGASGMVIPLARHSFSLSSYKSIDFDAISSHAISVREYVERTITSGLLSHF
jgi:hypothetical protein